ncbi:MAG: DUF6456 domain-containing protein [Pseudomonadota bacterium]
MKETDVIGQVAAAVPAGNLPDWVPSAAQMYLAHTEAGLPIRALARAAGCHASTILRQIRRIETRRDDPLVDAALRNLGAVHFKPCSSIPKLNAMETEQMTMHEQIHSPENASDNLDDSAFRSEAARVLRRMCETGSVLAVAADMDMAVIVRDSASGAATRTGVVNRKFAEALALKEWIAAKENGRITRYKITSAGRMALDALLQVDENRSAGGFAETQQAFDLTQTSAQDADSVPLGEANRQRRLRYALAESPLTALSRRKDKAGDPFLGPDLVTAGERLREDFELAQMEPGLAQNWERFLTSGASATGVADSGVGSAPSAARQRVADALRELGPGLSDVALRCCCHLEGLETAEKKLGWSARSGKIVLRIALIRLKRHYDETIGPGGPLIG